MPSLVLPPPPRSAPLKQLCAVLGEDDAHSLVGLATPSTYRGCRELAYATLLDLHVAAREQGGLANSGSSSGVGAKEESARGGAALTHAQRETVRCALLRGLSDPDDDGERPSFAVPLQGCTLNNAVPFPGLCQERKYRCTRFAR